MAVALPFPVLSTPAVSRPLDGGCAGCAGACRACVVPLGARRVTSWPCREARPTCCTARRTAWRCCTKNSVSPPRMIAPVFRLISCTSALPLLQWHTRAHTSTPPMQCMACTHGMPHTAHTPVPLQRRGVGAKDLDTNIAAHVRHGESDLVARAVAVLHLAWVYTPDDVLARKQKERVSGASHSHVNDKLSTALRRVPTTDSSSWRGHRSGASGHQKHAVAAAPAAFDFDKCGSGSISGN